MEKKIYVVGLDDEKQEASVAAAVKAVLGVSDCVVSALKAQVLVTFDESVGGVEDAVNNAIKSCSLDVLN